MKKIFWVLGIGLLCLIIVVVLIGIFYIGPFIKIGMEQVGPKVTQVTIKVDSVDVSLLTGSAKVKGLIVGNPEGYSTPQAISVGNIAVSIDPLSVTSSKILIHSVQVESPEITFEGGLFNGNNLSKILDNVNSFSKNNAPGANNASANTNTEGANKPAPKIEVDDFLITGSRVHVHLSKLGNQDISLPDIHLTDLGKDSNGLTPAELTSAVLGAISKDTLKAVANSVGKLGHGLENFGEGAGNKVGGSVNSITSKIGGLFGK